jgi:hypothetical protein
MVRANQAGSKSQTRRVIKPGLELPWGGIVKDGLLYRYIGPGDLNMNISIKCPYGVPGDRLWVRETWAKLDDELIYKADGFVDDGSLKWRPAIHMPRWASRTTMEITAVRVERLQDISLDDLIAEGLFGLWETQDWEYACIWRDAPNTSKKIYMKVLERFWDSINSKRPGCSWADNPWVWVVAFKRVEAGL